MHPNGQIPAYEWNFSDVNPPVTAWAALYVYEREAEIRGEGDREFLARVFSRLLTNFTWWVNRKDPDDRNLFQGGFLGLDNIGVFDRSAPLPGGGTLEQADGTAWMALYCQWMLQIAARADQGRPAYLDMALKFIAHFAWIAVAMNPPGGELALGRGGRLLLRRDADARRDRDPAQGPLARRAAAAVRATVFDGELIERLPGDDASRLSSSPAASATSIPALANRPGPNPEGRRILSRSWTRRDCGASCRRCSTRRSSSARTGSARSPAATSSTPVEFDWGGQHYEVRYLPAESDTGMFGGNSNWRGPVWFPMNLVILRALFQLHRYYGDRLKVECPTGSGTEMNLLRGRGARSAARLTTTFTEDENGRRPVFGGIEKFQTDPHWHDLLLFHEYFHGDNGAGIGASHQTGWTGTVALLPVFASARRPQAAQALD